MGIRLKFFTPTLAAVAVAAAISAAPMATADSTPAQPGSASAPRQTCTSLGGSQTQCQSAGNVQLNDAPPAISNFFPLGDG